MNSIFTRRSIRQFKDKEIETEKMDKLLRAAMQAPSAGNQQPWDFAVVEGRENLEKLSEFAPFAQSLKTAGAAIIVMGNQERISKQVMWHQDASCASQNILLQAAELGLGGVWLGTTPHEDRIKFIRELFDIEEKYIPFSVLAIGYPNSEAANRFIDRFDESRIRYIK